MLLYIIIVLFQGGARDSDIYVLASVSWLHNLIFILFYFITVIKSNKGICLSVCLSVCVPIPARCVLRRHFDAGASGLKRP